MAQLSPNFFQKRFFFTFITATENGNFTSTVSQGPCKFFHNWSFARATYGEVPNNNDHATQRLVPKDPMFVKIQAQLHESLEYIRQNIKEACQKFSPTPVPAIVDHISGKKSKVIRHARELIAESTE